MGSDAAEGSPAVAPGAAEAAQVAHPGLDAAAFVWAAPDEDAAAEQVCSPGAGREDAARAAAAEQQGAAQGLTARDGLRVTSAVREHYQAGRHPWMGG